MTRNIKIVVAFSLILISATVFAAVHQRHLIRYYSDATKTTLVGITMTTCKANTIADGQVTPYYTIESVDCSTGGGGWEDPYIYCSIWDGLPNCP